MNVFIRKHILTWLYSEYRLSLGKGKFLMVPLIVITPSPRDLVLHGRTNLATLFTRWYSIILRLSHLNLKFHEGQDKLLIFWKIKGENKPGACGKMEKF